MRILRPLGHGTIALLWSSLALSAIGGQLYAVALAWLAVDLIGAAAGYVAMLQSAAVLAAALVAGSLADPWDDRLTMIGAHLARAAVLLLVVGAGLVAGLSIGLLLLAAVVVAGAQAFFRPALQASLPSLAPSPALLPPTNALFDATERIARLVGPALAGLLSGVLPVLHLFTLDAAGYVVSALVIAWLPAWPRRPPPTESRRALLRVDLPRALAALRGHPLLSFAFAVNGVINAAWYIVFFLAVPLIIDERRLTGFGGTGLGAYGLVMASYGATNLVANIVVGGSQLRRPARLIFSGNVCLGVGILAMAVGGRLLAGWDMLTPLAAGAALSAIGGPMQDIPIATLLQTRLAPAELPGVIRLFLVMSHGTLLVAMLAAPTLVGLVGTLPLIALCGLVIIAVGLAGLARFHGAEAPAFSS